jgi:DDE superfamily endonuclease
MPPEIMNLMVRFAPVFQRRTWRKAQEMMIGAILAPGKRTVSSILQVLGKSQETNYARYHHVLNRAQWSSKELSARLLRLVVGTFGGDPVVLGIDEHIELAVLCTDPPDVPTQIVKWFVLRWQVEVTFHEARAHLGVETQRQWSDPGDCPYHPHPVGSLFQDYSRCSFFSVLSGGLYSVFGLVFQSLAHPSPMPSPGYACFCGSLLFACRLLTTTSLKSLVRYYSA